MLQKSSVWRVASIFFKEPTKKHYLLEISRTLHLAHTSVKNHLTHLREQGIIQEEQEIRGTRTFPQYSADVDNREYKHNKKLYNLDSIKELTEYLEKKILPQTIILFGSYSRGEDDETSDIDLYVQACRKKITVLSFEKKLGRCIELHFKSKLGDFPEELAENIRNGITLQGYLESQHS